MTGFRRDRNSFREALPIGVVGLWVDGVGENATIHGRGVEEDSLVLQGFL